tara:strand:+ start:190 stop:621 length:432 start_codon:yes stop_codon:yes gene_type:complete
MNQKRVTQIILVLALLGVALSAFTLAYKYGVASADFCTINETFDCGTVNQSSYSVLLGIPVSALGIIGYGFIALAAVLKLFSPLDKSLTNFLTIAAIGALAFSLYLSGIEEFVLHTWCLLCIGSQAIIIILTGFVLKLRTYDK